MAELGRPGELEPGEFAGAPAERSLVLAMMRCNAAGGAGACSTAIGSYNLWANLYLDTLCNSMS